jgi:16S rRNA G1207 methylase RsmC
VLDLGCGWGPIALSIAALSPATEVWAIDVNNRSVELTEKNAGALGLTNLRAVLPQALPRDLRFQEIWSNPPVRIGKAQLHQLLTNYLGLLRPGGRAMLVVQKQLGAESLLRWLNEHSSGYSARKILAERGYWVVEVMSPTGR